MAPADARRVGCNFVKRRREPAPARLSVEQDDLTGWLAESSFPTDPESLRASSFCRHKANGRGHWPGQISEN